MGDIINVDFVKKTRDTVDDLRERITRIKNTIESINKLMAELQSPKKKT